MKKHLSIFYVKNTIVYRRKEHYIVVSFLTGQRVGYVLHSTGFDFET